MKNFGMLYTVLEYAKKKGVSQPRISKLIKEDKLIRTPDEFGKLKIVDCTQNDKLFDKAAWNAKRKTEKKQAKKK